MSLLFETADYQVRELRRPDLHRLQALFEANPGYFLIVGGQPPRPDEAVQAFEELPPSELRFRERWFAGVFDAADVLQGLLIMLSDLCAEGVWHTALFYLADSQHGTGRAARLHAGMQAWALTLGACWLRLGVVRGNAAAERFWQTCGYREVRSRTITDASGRPRTVRVLVKPLVPKSLESYLERNPRDRPDSDLP